MLKLVLLATLMCAATAFAACSSAAVSASYEPEWLAGNGETTMLSETIGVSVVTPGGSNPQIVTGFRIDAYGAMIANGSSVEIDMSGPSLQKVLPLGWNTNGTALLFGPVWAHRTSLCEIDVVTLDAKCGPTTGLVGWSISSSGREGGMHRITDDLIMAAGTASPARVFLLSWDDETLALTTEREENSGVGLGWFPYFGVAPEISSDPYHFFIGAALGTNLCMKIHKTDPLNAVTGMLFAQCDGPSFMRPRAWIDENTFITDSGVVALDRAANTLTTLAAYFTYSTYQEGTVGGYTPPTEFVELPFTVWKASTSNNAVLYTIDTDMTKSDVVADNSNAPAAGKWGSFPNGQPARFDLATGNVHPIVTAGCCAGITSASACGKNTMCGVCRSTSSTVNNDGVAPYNLLCEDGNVAGPTAATCDSWHFSAASDLSYQENGCTHYLQL